MPTPPLSTVVVTKASATLDFPGAELFPMNDANHKSICRFPGETANFKKLALALQRIGSKALDVSPVLDRASTNSSNINRTCINLLNDHDVANDMDLPPKPVPGTCQWIHHHHLFTSWLNEGRSALLWLTGDPGSGKTMLSYSVANHLGGLRTISKNVLLYLCQDKNKQTDGKAVLIGLIRQIVDRHTSMIKNYVRHFFKKHPSIVQSFPLLWRLFLKLLKDPKVSSLYVILDALDECDERSCYQLLDSIYDILADPNQPMRDAIRVKFLITSRPILQSSYTNPKKDYQSQISIGDEQFGYTEDLRTSKKDFQNVIDNIPEDLKETYRRFLSAVPDAHQTDASQMLQMLIASSRPLHLDELNIAFTIESSHVTTAEGILGPLQFLLEDITTDHGIPPALQSVNAQSSALRLATACIQYLLLDDFSIDLFPTDTALAGPGSDMPQVLDELPLSESTGNFWDDDDQMLESDFLFRDSDALNPANCRNWIRFYRTRAANSPDDAFLAQDPVTSEPSQSIKNRSLYWASRLGHSGIVASLLGVDADPNSTELERQTALTTAAEHASSNGHIEVIKLLLEKCADIAIVNDRGETPLIAASSSGHVKVVKVLLKEGADITFAANYGWTALIKHQPVVMWR
ncbi:general substrate transporter [Purpureocillium lavendulum]|uniref:General substrate transporter n=1 Tax=Purpureocillium lavendulum TaxID=1247861 RepID=A0AB34G2B6_9HYPO|nr:general substrate transporter [Purpureocillium lavendulum]